MFFSNLEILQEPKSKDKLKLGDLKYLKTLWRLICIFDGWLFESLQQVSKM